MTIKEIAPWLSRNGNAKSADELKKISKLWSANVWESYLKTLEVSQKEMMIDDHRVFMALAEKSAIQDWYKEKNIDVELFKTKILEAFEFFSETEAKVIKMTFWENKSERAIAKKMDVARRTVRKAKERALRKLNKYFIGLLEDLAAHDAAQFPINEGGMNQNNYQNQQISEELHDYL